MNKILSQDELSFLLGGSDTKKNPDGQGPDRSGTPIHPETDGAAGTPDNHAGSQEAAPRASARQEQERRTSDSCRDERESRPQTVTQAAILQLDAVHRRFARSFARQLAESLEDSVTMTPDGPARLQPCRTWLASMPGTGFFALLACPPLASRTLLFFGQTASRAILSLCFGTTPEQKTVEKDEKIPLTALEQAVIVDAADFLPECLAESWEPFFLAPKLLRTANNSSDIFLTEPDSPILVTNFALELGAVRGTCSLGLPENALAALRPSENFTQYADHSTMVSPH